MRHSMSATSSQRLNLRPISRSMPTSSKPQLAVQRDATPRRWPRCGRTPHGTHWSRRRRAVRRAAAEPMPSAVAVAADVDRVLDAGAIGGALLVRRQRREPRPPRPSASSGSDGDDGREGAGAGGEPLPAGRAGCGAPGRRWPRCAAPRGCRWCGSPRHRPTRGQAQRDDSHGGEGSGETVSRNRESPVPRGRGAAMLARRFAGSTARHCPLSSVGRATPW